MMLPIWANFRRGRSLSAYGDVIAYGTPDASTYAPSSRNLIAPPRNSTTSACSSEKMNGTRRGWTVSAPSRTVAIPRQSPETENTHHLPPTETTQSCFPVVACSVHVDAFVVRAMYPLQTAIIVPAPLDAISL